MRVLLRPPPPPARLRGGAPTAMSATHPCALPRAAARTGDWRGAGRGAHAAGLPALLADGPHRPPRGTLRECASRLVSWPPPYCAGEGLMQAGPRRMTQTPHWWRARTCCDACSNRSPTPLPTFTAAWPSSAPRASRRCPSTAGCSRPPSSSPPCSSACSEVRAGLRAPRDGPLPPALGSALGLPAVLRCAAASARRSLRAVVFPVCADLLPSRYGRYVVSPMGLGFSFYIGANNVSKRPSAADPPFFSLPLWVPSGVLALAAPAASFSPSAAARSGPRCAPHFAGAPCSLVASPLAGD